MNILIQGSGRSFEVHYSLCKVLLDEYPNAKFGYFSSSTQTMSLFKNSIKPLFQTYSPYNFDAKFDYESNINLIREFENYSGKSIWKMIAADRAIGWHDDLGNYGTYIEKCYRSDRKYLINEVACSIREMSAMFNDFKPDIFIPAKAMGDVSVFILEALCIKSGVEYILPEYSRVSNLYRISNCIMDLSPVITNDFHTLMISEEINSNKRGAKLFDEMTTNSKNIQSFDKDFMKTYNLAERNNIFNSYNLLKKFIYAISSDLFHFIKKCIKLIKKPSFKFSTIWHKFKLSLTLRSQKFSNSRVVLDKSFGELPERQQKYLYFPLYNIPEYSSNFMSTMWVDIVSVIGILAKSVPIDWIIVVKEHPTSIVYNFREKNFYDKISRIPNVIFAPVLSDSKQLISNAELVFVTVGTSGWEAILNGVPVLSPVENFWDCMQLSRKSSDIESLHDDIKQAVTDNNKINQAERRKRVACFLEALIKNSFTISNPEVFAYYYQGTKEQYSLQGIELGRGIIKFLKKSNIDKSIGNKKFFCI